MYTIIHGDILTPVSPNTQHGTVVCHQVNCQGVMGAGLAKQVKTRFPSVFDAYLEKCMAANSSSDLLGSVQFCSVLNDVGYIVANIFGQNMYGRTGCYTDYGALKNTLETIAKVFPNDTIRIPYKMGCGLAGGDWETVENIIQTTLRNQTVEIWML